MTPRSPEVAPWAATPAWTETAKPASTPSTVDFIVTIRHRYQYGSGRRWGARYSLTRPLDHRRTVIPSRRKAQRLGALGGGPVPRVNRAPAGGEATGCQLLGILDQLRILDSPGGNLAAIGGEGLHDPSELRVVQNHSVVKYCFPVRRCFAARRISSSVPAESGRAPLPSTMNRRLSKPLLAASQSRMSGSVTTRRTTPAARSPKSASASGTSVDPEPRAPASAGIAWGSSKEALHRS